MHAAMPHTPDWLDRLVRAGLRAPGVVMEWIDGVRVDPEVPDREALVEAVHATLRHPEAYLGLEPGLHHTRWQGFVLGWEHRGRTAFGVGGLNAPGDATTGLLGAFVRDTSDRGIVRQLAFPVRDVERGAVAAAGFTSVQVGVEAWLDLPGLTWRGRRFAHVRQMRNRARRKGVTVGEVAPGTCREALASVHAAWLAAKRPSWRMKLLVGSPALDWPLRRRYFVARSAGRVEAFVTVLPGAAGTWGLDVLARMPDALPGTMEHLLVHVVDTLRDEGAQHLSLGACPMAGVPVSREHPILTRTFRFLYDTALGNSLFGFRSLWTFKQKFRPRWEPVYFAARPRLGVLALYRGCRMWGLY